MLCEQRTEGPGTTSVSLWQLKLVFCSRTALGRCRAEQISLNSYKVCEDQRDISRVPVAFTAVLRGDDFSRFLPGDESPSGRAHISPVPAETLLDEVSNFSIAKVKPH